MSRRRSARRLLVPGAVAEAQEVAKLDKDLTAASSRLPSRSRRRSIRAGTAFSSRAVRQPRPARQGRAGGRGRALAAGAAEPRRRRANVDFRSVELKLDLIDKLTAEGGQRRRAAAAPAAGATGATGAPEPGATAPPADHRRPRGRRHGGHRDDRRRHGHAAAAALRIQVQGNFYKLENLIHNVYGLVRSATASSPSPAAWSVEGFAMKRGKVTIVATTYMLPADQGLFAGATPRVPPARRPPPRRPLRPAPLPRLLRPRR